MSVREGSAEYHTLLYMYKLTFILDLCRERVGRGRGGLTLIFCYVDSHYVQKANKAIEQGERCPHKDIPLRGQPFDSEGAWHFFGNKYSDLENAENK